MSPTYKNITSIRKEIERKVLEKNQEHKSLVYYNQNDVGLLKTDDFPYFNPVLFSHKFTSSLAKHEEIQIPEYDSCKNWVSAYTIHISVIKGEVSVLYNSLINLPELLLYPDSKWNTRCFERTINKLFLKLSEDAVVYVIIEKISK